MDPKFGSSRIRGHVCSSDSLTPSVVSWRTRYQNSYRTRPSSSPVWPPRSDTGPPYRSSSPERASTTSGPRRRWIAPPPNGRRWPVPPASCRSEAQPAEAGGGGGRDTETDNYEINCACYVARSALMDRCSDLQCSYQYYSPKWFILWFNSLVFLSGGVCLFCILDFDRRRTVLEIYRILWI